MNTPHPGSEAARDQGCICPVIDNTFGAGCRTVMAVGSLR
jgi:hypothetical protein